MALLAGPVTRGRRQLVVSTRVEDADGALVATLREAGVELWQMPVTRVRAVEPIAGRDGAPWAGDMAGYDWLVFTSRHAVDIAWQREDVRTACSPSGPRRPQVAAVGFATARRLEALGVEVAVVSPQASGASLAGALLAALRRSPGGQAPAARVLWPCARDARPEMVAQLREAGVKVEPWVVYESRPVVPDAVEVFKAKLLAGEVDAVSFCAPSAVAALERALGGSLASLRNTRIVSIGPTTSASLSRAGFPPVAQAAEATGESLALAILESLASSSHEACR